jgi:hypothetical protein
MQTMPMMMFSALLIITLKAWFGANAAGTPTIAVVYPDRTPPCLLASPISLLI